MVDMNYLLKRGKIDVDINSLISRTVLENGCKTREVKGMYVFTAKCPSVLVDAAIACKNTIENGTCLETEQKEVFQFIEKVWTKCDKVLTNKQFVSLAEDLSEKMPAMLESGIVVKSDFNEGVPFDFDMCYDFMMEFFKSFLDLREGEYITNSLYYPYSDLPLDEQFLGIFKDYAVFTDKYKDFQFGEAKGNEDMYSAMKRLIEELPTK